MNKSDFDSGLDELYRDILMDHYRSPRNHGHVTGDATHRANGSNPLCGDEIEVELSVDNGHIVDVAFVGRGCSISQASASMMTLHVRDMMLEDALESVESFQGMMLEGDNPPDDFGDIEALAGVRKFPVRVKCASLSWKTLERALTIHEREDVVVTTDERNGSDD